MKASPVSARKEELQKQIAELKNSWPAHSVPPAMLEQLEDLEEELANLQKITTIFKTKDTEEND
jgi:hypothetical protein